MCFAFRVAYKKEYGVFFGDIVVCSMYDVDDVRNP